MYRNAPSMSLYKLSRIEEIENGEEYKEYLEKIKNRREGAKKANTTKLNKLLEYVENIKITLPKISKEKLVKNACKNYNDWNYDKEEKATKDSDRLFLDRICVNYLRHQLTEYEEELDNIFGKVGTYMGYEMIRDKVFSKIAKNYPWLKEECERQNGGEIDE